MFIDTNDFLSRFSKLEEKIDKIKNYLELLPEIKQALEKEQQELKAKQEKYDNTIIEVEFYMDPRTYTEYQQPFMFFPEKIFKDESITIIKDTRKNLFKLISNYFDYFRRDGRERANICFIKNKKTYWLSINAIYKLGDKLENAKENDKISIKDYCYFKDIGE